MSTTILSGIRHLLYTLIFDSPGYGYRQGIVESNSGFFAILTAHEMDPIISD